MSDTVKVILDSDPNSGYWYYPTGPSGGGALRDGRGIGCEIPREQYDRWLAAEEANLAMQAEIKALIDDAPHPLPGHTTTKFVLVCVRDSGEPDGACGPYSEGRAKWLTKVMGSGWTPVVLTD